MHWFRIHASRIAVTALFSLVMLGVSAASPHAADCHDAGCRAVTVEHDPSAHVIGAPPVDDGSAPLQHCLVCHLVRSFRPLVESGVSFASAPDAGVTTHVEIFTAVAAACAAQPSLRSPPSSPLPA